MSFLYAQNWWTTATVISGIPNESTSNPVLLRITRFSSHHEAVFRGGQAWSVSVTNTWDISPVEETDISIPAMLKVPLPQNVLTVTYMLPIHRLGKKEDHPVQEQGSSMIERFIINLVLHTWKNTNLRNLEWKVRRRLWQEIIEDIVNIDTVYIVTKEVEDVNTEVGNFNTFYNWTAWPSINVDLTRSVEVGTFKPIVMGNPVRIRWM